MITVDLYQGDLPIKIENGNISVKSLVALGVVPFKASLFQFNSISNLSWTFGSNEQVLALAIRLFFLGVLPKFLEKYNVSVEEAVRAGKASILVGTPEEKEVFVKVLNDKELLSLIEDVRLYLNNGISKQELERKLENYIKHGKVPKESEKFFIEDLFQVLRNISI